MSSLAERITRKSSVQTYITIMFLVDKPLMQQCFQAYAYFRWLDDQIDLVSSTKKERLRCIKRQQQLIQESYDNTMQQELIPEEQLIADLIQSNRDRNSKLAMFIMNFFEIIAFDARRKHSLISKKELDWYSKTLSIAVTSGIEYFINSNYGYPSSSHRYDAGIAAHIAHMLRDYREDLNEGFFNIPKEYLKQKGVTPQDIDSADLRELVKIQVQRARTLLITGKAYISRLPVLRGKLAAYWYCCRFENILDRLEKDNYVLHETYPRRFNLSLHWNLLKTFITVCIKHLGYKGTK